MDDERIDIDLDALPKEVKELTIVVNVFSSYGSFAQVHDAYVRMCAIKNGHEFARYKLDAQIDGSALIFAKLHKGPIGNWLFTATGTAGSGTST